MLRSVLRKATFPARAWKNRNLSQFSSSPSREPAVEAEFPQLKYYTDLFINGEFVKSKSGFHANSKNKFKYKSSTKHLGKTFETYNPGNGQLLATVYIPSLS